MATLINGFSKMGREKKISTLISNVPLPDHTASLLEQFRISDSVIQQVLNSLSENTLTNFPLPFGIAPDFIINNKVYHIPLVTEESSVVAAMSKSAKIWSTRGGFHANVKSVTKTGQIHFLWKREKRELEDLFPQLKEIMLEKTNIVTSNMQKRGGGIKKIGLVDKTNDLQGYFQIFVHFETRDAMGANFINTCLETMAQSMENFFEKDTQEKSFEIIMSILSNFNPECLVETKVECPVERLKSIYPAFPPEEYARRFKTAVDMAKADVYRAVTHNKGIFNGIDAVATATGNDYRAIEAGCHAFACLNGQYQSLSSAEITDDVFHFTLEIPLAIGTVGGITGIHPLTQLSMKILGNPNVEELMMIMASAGLASNFAAVNALITSGIQKGHMKMHLSNILLQLKATRVQAEAAQNFFRDKAVSFGEVREFLENL